MQIEDKGTVEPSKMYFAMTNEFAKKALYYVINSGRFYCNTNYQIRRETLDSFLFIYVKEGKLVIQYDGHSFVVQLTFTPDPNKEVMEYGLENVLVHGKGIRNHHPDIPLQPYLFAKDAMIYSHIDRKGSLDQLR